MRPSQTSSRVAYGWPSQSAAWCLVAVLLSACGSKRLDTAVEPFAAGGSSAGVAGTGAAPGAPAEAGTASGSGGVTTGGSSGDAGLGGEPGPIATEPLVTLADFPDSYTVGPVTAERFTVTGQTFVDAWRATMSEAPSTPWVAQLVVPLNKPVQAGQLLHVSFWVDCEMPGDTGDCYTEYIFERASDPWEKSVTFPAHADQAWVQKNEYFSVVDGYAAGVAHMVFRLGYASQVLAIGGLEVEAIGQAP